MSAPSPSPTAATSVTAASPAAATAATTKSATATTGALLAGLGLVDLERTSADILAVDGLYRSPCLIVVGHLDEAEAP